MRRLWILHHYATLPNLNGHIRPYRFAKHLAEKEIETTIFAASFQHFSGDNLIIDSSKFRIDVSCNVPFAFVRTPSSASGGFARVRNMLSFYHGLFGCTKQYSKQNGKPDVVLASSPQPLVMVAGIRIAKKYGVPCICEVRDLWPEAIFTASGIKAKSLLGRTLTYGEYWIYRHADALIFTKEGDTDYLKEKGWTTSQGGEIDLAKCHYINNGIDLEEYDRQKSENKLDDAELADSTFKVVYSGAIRPVNNVGNILDAAKLLIDNDDIKFLIYGDGSEKAHLEARIRNEGLGNVVFKGFVEKKYLPYILGRSSVNLLNYSGTRYNWSRGNSSNKLFEYMASGKPVISTVRMGYSIIEKYGCGIELTELTPKALADAILIIKNLPQDEYNGYCVAARNGAKDFDYEKLTDKLLAVFASVNV